MSKDIGFVINHIKEYSDPVTICKQKFYIVPETILQNILNQFTSTKEEQE